MDRKLASIQRIVSISPIEGADAIEKAVVLGWECVVAKKDNFRVGDLVIYIEVDSIVPPRPEFEFLKDRGYRVKTIRLRKQVSQGLILPLYYITGKVFKEGDDVTEILGITKYLSPSEQTEARLAEEAIARSKSKIKRFLGRYGWFRKLFFKKADKGFPKFIHKTDEDRVQLFPDICEREKDTIFTVTEKLDGQSGTWFLVKEKGFFRTKYRFGVCSRNVFLKTPNESSYWRIARKYNIESVLKKLIGDDEFVAIQGEIIGDGIQGNKYSVGLDMYAFNLIFPWGKVSHATMSSILQGEGLKTVPVLDYDFKLPASIPELVEYAKAKSTLKDIQREGVVIRNYDKNISFKVINPEFLLKYSE